MTSSPASLEDLLESESPLGRRHSRRDYAVSGAIRRPGQGDVTLVFELPDNLWHRSQGGFGQRSPKTRPLPCMYAMWIRRELRGGVVGHFVGQNVPGRNGR